MAIAADPHAIGNAEQSRFWREWQPIRARQEMSGDGLAMWAAKPSPWLEDVVCNFAGVVSWHV
jgi:hypothetical protein